MTTSLSTTAIMIASWWIALMGWFFFYLAWKDLGRARAENTELKNRLKYVTGNLIKHVHNHGRIP